MEEGFEIRLLVANAIEAGGGGHLYGDAVFNNVTVTVAGNDAYVRLLEGKGGPDVPGNKKKISVGTLEEGEARWYSLWVKAEKASSGPAAEKVARVLVAGDFDVDRYFHVFTQSSVYEDVQL